MATINRIQIVWIAGNAFLFVLGFIFGALHYPIDFDGLNCPKYEGDTLFECAMFGIPLGAVTGIIIGIGQAWLLRILSLHFKNLIESIGCRAAPC